MANLLNVCETMTNRWVTEKEMHVPLETIAEFAEKNHMALRESYTSMKTKYKLKRMEIPVHFISGDEEKEIDFLDISDLHIGNSEFDEYELRMILEQARFNNVKYVFIAGDVFEGAPELVSVEDASDMHFQQVSIAFQIFKDYPFKYYVINGNHDYMFEQLGLCNPIKRLAKQLEKEGIEFNFFDTYLQDFIIGGVVKRMMHVERQYFSRRKNFALTKLKKLEEEFGMSVEYEGVEYPIRFFHVGHIHTNVLIYNPRRKVFISLAGSFLKGDRLEDRGNIVSAKIFDGKVWIY